MTDQQFAELGSILGLSVYVSGTALVISGLVGVPLGLWLGLWSHPAKRVLRMLLHTGMALPPVVIGLLLYMLLSRSGPLGSLGWYLTPRAMILAQTVLAFPFVASITASSVAAIPAELLLQIRGLGATAHQAHVALLWEARHGVLLGLAAAFGRCISEVGAVMIVGGNLPGQTRVLTTAIVMETRQGDFHLALSMGAVLLTMALAANLVMLRLHADRQVV